MSQKVITTSQQKKNNSNLLKISTQIFFSYLLSFLIAIWIFHLLKINNVTIETIAAPNSLYNTLYILGVIIVETIILIVLIKYLKKVNIIKILDIIISFFAVIGILSFFFDAIWLPTIISIAIVLIKEFWKNSWFKNAIVFCVVGFFSAYFAYSIGILPIFVLLLAVAVYDIIAVFKTKHMIFLAKKVVEQNTLFVMDFHSSFFKKERNKETTVSKEESYTPTVTTTPTIRNKLNLGTGDFALPLIGILSLYSVNFYLGIVAFIVALAGLLVTIYLLFTKSERALPAIPLQVGCLLVVYLVYYVKFLV